MNWENALLQIPFGKRNGSSRLGRRDYICRLLLRHDSMGEKQFLRTCSIFYRWINNLSSVEKIPL